MKRFLAGILSAVLLMGSIPVYGAQDMGISPEAGYSVEGTELSQTEEALSGETALQETADTKIVDHTVYADHVVDCRQDYGWLIR